MTPDYSPELRAYLKSHWWIIGPEYRYDPVTSPDYGMGDYRWCPRRQGIMVRTPTFEWFRGGN